MRTFLSLVLFLQLCFVGVCFSADKLTETKLIRRAYIDMLGVLPTVTEVEWFTVYNNDGYKMAVEFLLSKTSKEEMRILLSSEEYEQNNDRILNIEEVMCIFLYLSGKKVGDISFSQAKQNLANNAVLCSSSDSEIIEYLCNALLCRDSNLQEANLIERYIRSSSNDKELWVGVIDLIITFNAFTHK